MEKWLAAGQPHVQTRLKEYGVEFLKDLPAPEDHEELIRKGEEFIEAWTRKSLKGITWVKHEVTVTL